MAVFYSTENQYLFHDIVWLPQEGATTGPSGRPPNSYAKIDGDEVILIDAAYPWTLPGIAALNDAGHKPTALVITHEHVALQGDAIDEIHRIYHCDIIMHEADVTEAVRQKLSVPFVSPIQHPALVKAFLDVIPLPYHTPGSIMLHTKENEGVMFTGDSAVAPGPKQNPEPPRLERPQVDAQKDAEFIDEWHILCAQRFFSSVLPLHGTPYVERNDMRHIHATLFQGAPMRPDVEATGKIDTTAHGVLAR